MSDILCHREQAYVGAQLTFPYDRQQIILEQNELAGRCFVIDDYFDKPLEVRWQVMHFPIASSESGPSDGRCHREQGLRHALSVVGAKQEQENALKMMTNSGKIGYKKRPRPSYGPGYEQTQSAIEVLAIDIGASMIVQVWMQIWMYGDIESLGTMSE